MVTPGRFRAYTAVVLLLTLVSIATAKYSGGSGTAQDPYQIATAADLILLGETPADYDKHFLLTADIDLDPNLPGRKVFIRSVISPDMDPETSGFQGTPFAGVFDGNGHTIWNLTVFGGLFGQLASGSEVNKLGVAAVYVIGADWSGCAGALVAQNFGAVTQCHSAGTVNGTSRVGGLVLHYS